MTQKPQKATGKKQHQLDLLDHGCHAGKTRNASYREAKKRMPGRKALIESILLGLGIKGATRAELAAAIGCKDGGVSAAVSELLDEGRIVETAETHTSNYGRPNAVLVAAEVAKARATA